MAEAWTASPRRAWSPNGTEYEVDCLIYSTGFSARSLPPFQAGDYQVVGFGGQDLGEPLGVRL